MKVLVTGATGFVGSHILEALREASGVETIAACRDAGKLPDWFKGEVRQGDLVDKAYRKSVLNNIDVVCHTGSFGTFWGHAKQEYRYFYEPTRDFIDQAVKQGVQRFIQTSTVTLAPLARDKYAPPADEWSLARKKTGFWPHVDYLMDLDRYMRSIATNRTQMVTMRLGHFVGPGNTSGLLPMLLPRMRTHLVPWMAGGHMRLPLVTGEDMGRAFMLAATANSLGSYESFNIVGSEYPTIRELFSFIAKETGFSTPHYSVPYPAAYAFGWLMEKLRHVIPGDPFLMRSVVFVCENWMPVTDNARQKLGYIPREEWQSAVRKQIMEIKQHNYPWPRSRVSN